MRCGCRADGAAAGRAPGRLTRTAVALLALLALAVAGCGAPYGAPRRVVVPSGARFAQTADSLAKAGIVRWPRGFRLYAKLTRRDRSVRAGTYLLQRGSGWGDVLDALTRGRGLVRTVTVPEGFALSDIAPLLARALDVPADSVRVAARDTALLQRLGVPTRTLEGYLFPDTYQFPDGTSARDAVAVMVRRFEQVWRPEWNERLAALALGRHEVVTLASIVEKEARLAPERPVIAAVYLNRLRTGMLLQADPTVQYALGRHTTRVLFRDLEVDSPYNTYKYKGLPPGPIASPGRASLEAALYPADVPYRYFVAYPDGHHEFRTTFDDHVEAARRARRARRAAQGR
ncbi:MAG TPA: endolytic transglycosylase MltG [Gemmatimonadaceae bacterium]|nr:endolytic transglycosylase MltG [Gemmatimonadaceae bacterium]